MLEASFVNQFKVEILALGYKEGRSFQYFTVQRIVKQLDLFRCGPHHKVTRAAFLDNRGIYVYK